MQTFQYEALNLDHSKLNIRVLKVLPGNGQIHCELKHVSLSNNPHYEAISYCWGSSIGVIDVICDSATIKVTPSLHAALEHFRLADITRVLWADQLCINQEDVEERNFQVSIMREVYQQSSHTLVWLGELEEDTKGDDPDMAFALSKRLSQAEKTRNAKIPPDKRLMFDWDAQDYVEYDLPKLTDKAWLAFSYLWYRPWFRRLWVVQEVVLSVQVTAYCRNSSISWDDLAAASRYANVLGALYLFSSNQDDMKEIDGLRARYRAGKETSLTNLLMETNYFNATNHRDRVYSLLGIASDATDVVPDYRLEVSDVYHQTTITILRQLPCLDILSAAGEVAVSGSSTLLPSWVYDTRDKKSTAFLVTPKNSLREGRFPIFSASGQSISSPIFSNDQKMLGLIGHQVDEINLVGHADNTGDIFEVPSRRAAIQEGAHYLKCLAQWENIARSSAPQKYFNEEELGDVFWQILCLGCTPETYPVAREEFQRLMEANRAYRLFRRLHLTSWQPMCFLLLGVLFLKILLQTQMGVNHTVEARFMERIDGTTERRFFKSKTGLLGLAPEAIQKGDQIFLLKGGKIPMVLRAVGPNWKLIGEAYVHGLMFGEAFGEEECKFIWLI